MFWDKKDKKSECTERALSVGVASTKISLIFTLATVWISQYMPYSPVGEVIWNLALSFALVAMACFFILLLHFIYKRTK